jgi:hypothetical protein
MPREVYWTLVQYLRFGVEEPGWVKFQHAFTGSGKDEYSKRSRGLPQRVMSYIAVVQLT